MKGHGFNPRWRNFLFILWVFRFISKMSQESQVNLNFVDYALLCLRLFAISISPQSEERQVWPVGCLRAGCKIGRHQKWQRRLILKNHTLCTAKVERKFCRLHMKYVRKSQKTPIKKLTYKLVQSYLTLVLFSLTSVKYYWILVKSSNRNYYTSEFVYLHSVIKSTNCQ